MRTFSRLLGFALEHKWQLSGAYVCLFVSSAAFLVVPRLLGDAIDTALEAGGTAKLLWAAGTILGVSVIRGVFAYGQQYLGESLGQKVSYRLRNTFYNHLQGLSFAYFDQQHTGNLMSRATVDVENLRMFISMVLIRSLYLVILLVAVSVILINMNWQLGLLSLSFTPLLIFRSVVVSRYMRVVWVRVQESIGQLTTLLQENLTGARVIRAFGAEGYERRRSSIHRRGRWPRRPLWPTGCELPTPPS